MSYMSYTSGVLRVLHCSAEAGAKAEIALHGLRH